jgi:RNA polymerase sigma factor (sigma-70 family)
MLGLLAGRAGASPRAHLTFGGHYGGVLSGTLQIEMDVGVAVEQRVAETKGLAVHLAVKYCRRYPRLVLDDLCQDLFCRLVRAAQLYRKRRNGPPFSAFALLCLKQACWEHVRRYGWPPREVSLDAVINDDDDEPLTNGDVYDIQCARADSFTGPGEMREAGRLDDVRQVVLTLDTLEPMERLVLLLRLDEGCENEETAALVGRSLGLVSTAAASGIRKLQAHFASGKSA